MDQGKTGLLAAALGVLVTASAQAQVYQADGLSFKGGRFSVELSTDPALTEVNIVSVPRGLTVTQRGETVEVAGGLDWRVCSNLDDATDLGVVKLRAPEGIRVAATDAVAVIASGQVGASYVGGCSRLEAEAVSGSVEAGGSGAFIAQRAEGDLALSVGGAGGVRIDALQLDQLSVEVSGGGRARLGDGRVETLVLETAGRGQVELAALVADATVLQGSRAPLRLAEVGHVGGVRQGCEPGIVTSGPTNEPIDLPDVSSSQACRW